MTYVAKRTEGEAGAPLFFTFHGTGGSEEQFHDFARDLVPGAHVVSPRGDVSEMGALRYFRRTGEGIYDMEDLSRRTEAMAEFLAAERARVAPGRVIALGYSNGANILAAVSFRYPEIVDDMILMHPLIPWTPEAQPGLAGRRVLVSMGEKDPICPMPMNLALCRYYEDQGATVATAIHPGGHEIRQTEVEAVVKFLPRA